MAASTTSTTTNLLKLFGSSPSSISLKTPKSPSLPFLSLLSPKPLSLRKTYSLTPLLVAQEEEQLVLKEEEEEEEQVDDVVAEAEQGDSDVVEEGEGDGDDADSYPEPPEEAKLFVGNLPYDIDSEALAGLFDKAGIVEVAEVIFSRETGQSRGFGFVTMSTIEEADKAVEILHRYDINGRLLTVNKAAPRGARVERTPREFEPSFRIYVGNLAWQIDDARLEQVFSEHGKVVSARVVYDRETGRSRGFGFVTMASQNELDDAIAALDGQSLDGRAIRVNVAEERPRRTF